MVNVFGNEVTASFIASLIYIICSFILFIVVCIYGWKKMKIQEKESDDLRNRKKYKRYIHWLSLVWKMKSIYLSALVHIYDIGTDIGIIVDWGFQAFDEKNLGPEKNVRGLNMMGLFATSCVAFLLYRFISAGFVYEFTGKFKRAFVQFWDLEIYHAIYITHKLGRNEAGNLQRWLQKFEAIFESAPQALLQMVYIVKTADYAPLIISSIVLSFFSVAARFTSDDRIFFNKDAEGLGLKWEKRKKPKLKEKPKQQTNNLDDINLTSLSKRIIELPQIDDDDKDKKNGKNESDKDEFEELWSKWKVWKHLEFNRAYLFRYSFRMCDVFSRLMILALIWCSLSGTVTFFILIFEVLTFVVYAVGIGKYNFFQFLVATYFSEDNRDQTVSYCFFRRMESLIYLMGVSVVILFSARYNDDSIAQCYKEYCTEENWDIYHDGNTPWPSDGVCPSSTGRLICTQITNYDRTICDCNLEEEVNATKLLLIAAWSFANLSGAVFFGAFHSMRQKFGTNERNIVNVLEKRDWDAFSEMLQFGYRMNRFDKKSQRSALTTYLDRVPNDKFDAEEVDRMIILGAHITDQSLKPQDKDDELEPDKIGDNVLIRYIKVTPCDVIDKEFENVVKKWSTDGVKGGDYRQDLSRITVNINTKNDNNYTAFKVYWEKVQYERREKRRIRNSIIYKRKCHEIENELTEEEKFQDTELDHKEEMNELWFDNFYRNILKWKKLGADMSTLSEDRISPLLAYIQDTDIKHIDMDIVKLLCPVDETSLYDTNDTNDTNTDNNPKGERNEEEKYELESVSIDDEAVENSHVFSKEIKMKAFSTWIEKYTEKEELFEVSYVKIWHELGCTERINTMNLLSTYLQKCQESKQNTDDIDLLMNCGCDLENKQISQFISRRPLPMNNVVDNCFVSRIQYEPGITRVEKFDQTLGRWCKLHGISDYVDDEGDGKFTKWIKKVFGGRQAMHRGNEYFRNVQEVKRYYHSYAVGHGWTQHQMYPIIEECWNNDQAFNYKAPPVNLEMFLYLKEKYNMEPEVPITNGDVYDLGSYGTRLQKMIETQEDLTVDNIKKLLKMGYLLVHKGGDIQQCLLKAVANGKLPFDVFEFLLNAVLTDKGNEDQDEEKKDNEDSIELDHQIFSQWIQSNENITFEQIKILIEKYGFSPFKLITKHKKEGCSIDFIWKNSSVDLEVMHKYWMAYGVTKFGKYEGLYQGFLYDVFEFKELTEIKQIEFLQDKFKDFIEKSDKETGNNIIHFYCKNTKLNMKILQYICTKYKKLLDEDHARNKKDHHALHLLSQNASLKIEYLQYFVETLKVPMNIKTHAGWQPFEAFHYLVDNKSVEWKKNDIKIMIGNLNIDFMTRRAGEIILYRLSHQNNFTTEALIYLYRHYRDKVELNKMMSQKQQYVANRATGGTTILANLLKRKLPITPNQIKILVETVGLDITAKDNDNGSILHYAANAQLTAPKLKLIGFLLIRNLKDQFVADVPKKSGATPFQLWIKDVNSKIVQHMDIVKVWEDLGADLTQSENGTAFNMLHHYLSGKYWEIKLTDLRKMCFDDANPWASQEKILKKIDDTKRINSSSSIKRAVGKYQIPLHVRPIPDNMTLARIYTQNVMNSHETININLIKYFRSKEEIRFDLKGQESVLWIYMKNKYLNLAVIKYLIHTLKCKIQPQPSDNIAMRYMQSQNKRDKIDWDILDYFHFILKVDFKFKQSDYITILHEYSKYSKVFNCQEFEKLINKYDLKDMVKKGLKGSTDPTAAGTFYDNRRAEIRADIIKCFTNLGYDINEPINGVTPIQYYCDLTDNHYIMPQIIKSFIDDGRGKLDYYLNRKSSSISQLIVNSGVKYDKLNTLQMMIDKFNVKLNCPKKQNQDMCFILITRYHDGVYLWHDFFDKFIQLLRFYIISNVEPIHLFQGEDDNTNKKIKFKLYRVKDIDYLQELQLKKNKKKLKDAKKYIGRIIFVTDARDSVFRSCKPIDPRCDIDWATKKIPEKWLIPIRWKQFIQEIDDLQLNYNNFQKSLKIAETNYFIDMNMISNIKSLHSSSEMIKDVQPKYQSILIKYLKSNHSSEISSTDINKMNEVGVDFNFGYSSSMDALRIYCSHSKNEGIINKSIVIALINGGCSINWDYEENEDDDDEKGQKGEVIKTSYTPLHNYCKLAVSNLIAFKSLVECKADVKIESAQNFNSVFYLLKHSKNVNGEFIKYLSEECNFNFNQPLSTQSGNDDVILFNMYLRNNKNINASTIRALVDIGDCDANSRDDINDTNSIKAYIQNENTENFNCEIISVLVELGAQINEPDNEGVYPIQHLLNIKYTPLSLLMSYVAEMIGFGAKLQDILCDDSLIIQDYKLYILQDMKGGYEHYNEQWCTIDAWTWEYNGRKNKVQSAVALDETGSNSKLYINIKRNNLRDIDIKKLLNIFPHLNNHNNDNEDILSDDEDDHHDANHHYDDEKEEEEEEEQVDDKLNDDNISIEIAKKTKT